jgi:methionyl-tRNA synthetase
MAKKTKKTKTSTRAPNATRRKTASKRGRPAAKRRRRQGAVTRAAAGRKKGAGARNSERKSTRRAATKTPTRAKPAPKKQVRKPARRKLAAPIPRKPVTVVPPIARTTTRAKPARKAGARRTPAQEKVAAKKSAPIAPKPATAPAPAPTARTSTTKRYYVTTAISYPNGPPHMGHAYEAIATDAIARFQRLDGCDVFFLTGTDEHGQKMQQTAAREGINPRELAGRTVPLFKQMVERLNCSNDEFIRTTEARHYRSSRAIWERMARNGDIYLSKYSGWYSVRDEAYYDDYETTVGESGIRLGPQGTPVEWVEEASYFFKLSAYQDKLLELYARVPDFVLPKERFNEVLSFVRRGLQDLSISRTTFDWGVPVPDDPAHVMYVWVDALTNYITAVGYPDTDSEAFRRYWPADLHVIGKDIVRFHAIYWPAFLMSAGIEVPRRIFSHGFLFNRGERMSKSTGNVVDPFALADAYGVDQLRYFLLREVPFGQDGNYSHETIVGRINADLANDLGNLAQRSLSMIARGRAGILPASAELTETDRDMLAAADAMVGKARDAMRTPQLHQVLNAVWAVVAEANRYFAAAAPWALAKTDPARQGTVLYVTAEVLRQIAILAQPFIPTSAAKLLDLLGVPAGERDFAALGGAHRIAAGTTLPAPSPVFPRYVEPAASAAS